MFPLASPTRRRIVFVAWVLAFLASGVPLRASYDKVVNVANGQTLVITQGGGVSTAAYERALTQHWQFKTVDGQYFALVSEDHDLALTPAGPTRVGVSLRVDKYTGADEQLWTITPMGGGKNRVATKLGGFALAARAGGVVLATPDADPAALWRFAVARPEIYIGGTHPLDYLADPVHAGDWPYVRAHAAGLYTSNVRLHSSYIKGPYRDFATLDYSAWKNLITRIGAQMTNRNLFYETDSNLTLDPEWDRRVLQNALDAGWTVSHAVLWDTQHKNPYPSNYLKPLKVGWPQRPVHVGVGTWTVGATSPTGASAPTPRCRTRSCASAAAAPRRAGRQHAAGVRGRLREPRQPARLGARPPAHGLQAVQHHAWRPRPARLLSSGAARHQARRGRRPPA